MAPIDRLSEEAAAKYREVFRGFEPASEMEAELAAQYCEAWETYVLARSEFMRDGINLRAGKNGTPYQNPAVGTANKASDQMRRIYTLLKSRIKRKGAEDDLL